MRKIKYPCTKCEKDKQNCNRQKKYLRCTAWRGWFHQQWEQIQKIFARDVSESHNEKGGDDE